MTGLVIFDTTLRDGEQGVGNQFLPDEKIKIALALNELGIDIIEAGFAANSELECQNIRAIGKQLPHQKICTLARCLKSDIDAATKALKNCVHSRIHLFIGTSVIHMQYQLHMTPEQLLEQIGESIQYAKNKFDGIQWSAMDATRSDFNFLQACIQTAIDAGARTICIPDTTGFTYPMEFFNLIKKLTLAFPKTAFSVHCHNDLGMATANSLSGILAGAMQVEGTINGIGERAGNAALEEVLMAMHVRSDIFKCPSNIHLEKIASISKLVSQLSSSPLPKHKAIVGKNAFSHASGIHQDGILKEPRTYEIISPETIGLTKRHIVLGKLSGMHSFKKVLQDLRISIDEDKQERLFYQFKKMCQYQKIPMKQIMTRKFWHHLLKKLD